MRLVDVVFGVLLALLVISAHDFLKDPYYHKEVVNFWTWAKREITELKGGEKS